MPPIKPNQTVVHVVKTGSDYSLYSLAPDSFEPKLEKRFEDKTQAIDYAHIEMNGPIIVTTKEFVDLVEYRIEQSFSNVG